MRILGTDGDLNPHFFKEDGSPDQKQCWVSSACVGFSTASLMSSQPWCYVKITR